MAAMPRSKESITSYIFEHIQDYSQLDTVLVQAIVACVMSAFEGGVTNEDALNHIKGDLITIDIDSRTEKALAFSSTNFDSPNNIFNRDDISDETGCYLAGATVAKEAQGLGLYKSMNELRISTAIEKGINLLFTRTQNPRVQAGIEAVLGVFQNSGIIRGYTVERILVPNCYGGQLTKNKPVDDQVSFGELNYEKGDAYILLFKLNYQPKLEIWR